MMDIVYWALFGGAVIAVCVSLYNLMEEFDDEDEEDQDKA